MDRPRIIVIAGPNGAGKTTFAQEFLPREAGCLVFLNADLIAAGLSPFDPSRAAMQAGRLMVAAIDQHVIRRDSFAFETTLSGLAYARKIPMWRAAGYRVDLWFLKLPLAELAVQRVAARVRQGGHDIPEATIRRRFAAGQRLFSSVYRPLVDSWALYDNSGAEAILLDWNGEHEPPPLHMKEPQPTYGALPPGVPQRLRDAYEALRRASQRAHEVAWRTGTEVVLMQDGKIVHVKPRPPQPPR
ncbi:MAG: zeta toxin family protein [Ramlibacter sp.]|nr:zeta toxin family protein [Ramlibacter sp.]